jgi:hypothetical protein
MRSYFSTASFFAASVVLSACTLNLNQESKDGEKVKLETVSINNDYSMGVPTYMTKASSLNESASLQFQNIFKETYVIVIDENKQEYIDAYTDLDAYDTTRSIIANYADTQVQSLTANVNVLNKQDVKTFKINGLDAASVEIESEVEGVKFAIAYFITFIEGPDNLYMIMAWTRQDRKDKYRSTFEQMVQSFQTKKSPVAVN